MRGVREQPARVLTNRPLEAAGEVFKRESAGSAQRPHRPKAEPIWVLKSDTVTPFCSLGVELHG